MAVTETAFDPFLFSSNLPLVTVAVARFTDQLPPVAVVVYSAPPIDRRTVDPDSAVPEIIGVPELVAVAELITGLSGAVASINKV